ncbi:secretion activator protein [Rhodoplanes serenus]|uniref:Secretion activator protein n=1 Tax=Rhodoplanes serenus TaxID=200615 RepID=A0A9X4XHH3_9BRAD|nr:glycosyl hydrolase 108 family protein [Rhodoplanes serenus]MTW15180.1 secretion activator protein [Rhodoplanes serenus]
MATHTYDEALRRLLVHEGGYTNHPSDPGGPTKHGITIHDYRRFIDPGGTAADVRAMTVDQAKAIYRARYWDALRCEDLPAGVDYAVFDYGVNSGIGRAGRVLRRLLGLPDREHTVTATVIAAVARRDPAALVAAICDERLAFLRRLKTWPVFGRGWGRRVAEVRATALRMASGRSDPPRRGITGAAAAGGLAAAGGAAGAAGAAGWLADAPPWALAGLAVALVLVAVAIGVALHWRRRGRPAVAGVPAAAPGIDG